MRQEMAAVYVVAFPVGILRAIKIAQASSGMRWLVDIFHDQGATNLTYVNGVWREASMC